MNLAASGTLVEVLAEVGEFAVLHIVEVGMG